MRVHILTHAVVECDGHEIYGMVAEHLERMRELGTVQSMQVHHGEFDYVDTAPELEVEEAQRVAWIKVNDQGLTVLELRKLAVDAIATAERLEKLPIAEET